jgi:hypothetical protein
MIASRLTVWLREILPLRGCGSPVAAFRQSEMSGNGYLSAEVHQAAGIITAQLGCSAAAALAHLAARAAHIDRTLNETALAVIDGSVRFDE